MSQTNTSDHETGLPISTPTSSERYKRLWKLSICVGVFVTLNRSSPSDACLPPISTSNSSSEPEVKIEIDIDIDVAFDGEEEVDCNGCDAVKEQPRPPVPNTVDQIVEEKDSRVIISLNTSSPSDAPLPSTSSGSSSQADVLINIYTPLDNVDCNELQQLHRNTVDQIVKERDLNALTDFGGTERVISIFGSHLETGLSAGPADPTACHTTNPAKHFFRFFLKACRSFTIFFLVVSAGLSLFTEILREGSKYGWHDGAIILMVVFLLVTLPSVSNFLRARKLEKEMLMRDNRLEVEVRRNGESQFVSISNIVQGDIVCLKEGNRVPGDGLYVEGDGLVVDEVLDSNIDRHHNPFLLSGSKVIEGNGHMIVTSVNTTPIGESMSMVNDVLNHEPTLLQTLIDEPNEYADKIALCMSILITLVMFLRFRKHHDNKELPEIKGKVPMEEVMKIFERALLKPRGLLSFLATYLPAVVLGFQHGVSLAITDSLSYWNAKAVSDDANPQNLSACGTMGFVTVICIDVSGGLTCSQMEVGKFFIGEKETNIHGEDCETSQIVPEALLRGIGISVLLPDNLKGPTDDLLNSWVQSKWGQSMDLWKENFAIVRQRSFNKKGRGVLIRKNGNEDDETIMHLHWKGSANTILGMCSHYHDSRGNSQAFEDQKDKFEQLITDMEEEGLRPIAFAYKQMEEQEITEDGLILLAVVGFGYKIGEETKSTVGDLRNAGLSIKLVSQDEPWKALKIARELGICSRDVVPLEGKQFRDLNPDDAKKEKTDQISVIGRCLHKEKLLMLQRLKQEGDVVAYYGGLTTADTVALKEADVGITEGTLSTEMAREGCDIIVNPGRGLCPLTPLRKYGRCAYHNIQRFIQLQLTACISGLLITVLGAIFLGDSPITAIHLIWVKLIICILGHRTMIMEPPVQALMAHQPQAKRRKPLMTIIMWRTFMTQVFYQASVLLLIQFKGQAIHAMKQEEWNSMIFNTFTLCQVFNLLNAMQLEKKEVFVVVIRHYWFLMALGVVIVMQVLVVEFVTTLAAGYVRLNWLQWAFCILFAVLSWLFDRGLTFILEFLSEWSLRSFSPHLGISARTPLPYIIPYMGFIFSAVLVFSISCYFNPNMAPAFL